MTDAFYGMNPHYEDWRYEVANGDTCLGLHDWVAQRSDRLEPLTQALAQIVVASESGSTDRHLNAVTYALNVACSLIPGMYTP